MPVFKIGRREAGQQVKPASCIDDGAGDGVVVGARKKIYPVACQGIQRVDFSLLAVTVRDHEQLCRVGCAHIGLHALKERRRELALRCGQGSREIAALGVDVPALLAHINLHSTNLKHFADGQTWGCSDSHQQIGIGRFPTRRRRR